MRALKMLALSLVTLTTVIGAKAQTADEVIAKNLQAMGGVEKLKALNSVYFEGNMEVPGAELPLKLRQINNKAMRIDFEFNGTENIQVVTADGGWMLLPVQNMTSPMDMPADQHKIAKRGLSLGGELLDYKEKNKKVELLGKETTNGQEAFKLKVTDADGTVTTFFIDASTYYVVRSETNISAGGQSITLKVTSSDYRKTPEGYVFPYVTTQESVGPAVNFNISKVEINKPIDEAIFKKPA
ncbi:hypothetical protein MKQ68_19490 [Chitinophaga horti]|uniref:Outer membrane lipoprotein-sorting protein n=1 Tax=Chitinophaga horti TaxID=2920382 RepID=A0ABY6IY32_9BACT|nr:hypothetical protein [Chitinophaga horti]UYQ92273.1 hypothetical protein MKQ68_19490 [Chitinophaga horti]